MYYPWDISIHQTHLYEDISMLSVQEAEVFPGKRPEKETIQRESMDSIQQRAERKNLELTPERMEAIEFVQDFYEHCDDCKNARQLMKIMHEEFKEQGGRKHLYRLFPDGPLSTIHELIDLPNLGNQVDLGFGTSY